LPVVEVLYGPSVVEGSRSEKVCEQFVVRGFVLDPGVDDGRRILLSRVLNVKLAVQSAVFQWHA